MKSPARQRNSHNKSNNQRIPIEGEFPGCKKVFKRRNTALQRILKNFPKYIYTYIYEAVFPREKGINRNNKFERCIDNTKK
jgi:hypothetical protein